MTTFHSSIMQVLIYRVDNAGECERQQQNARVYCAEKLGNYWPHTYNNWWDPGSYNNMIYTLKCQRLLTWAWSLFSQAQNCRTQLSTATLRYGCKIWDLSFPHQNTISLRAKIQLNSFRQTSSRCWSSSLSLRVRHKMYLFCSLYPCWHLCVWSEWRHLFAWTIPNIIISLFCEIAAFSSLLS